MKRCSPKAVRSASRARALIVHPAFPHTTPAPLPPPRPTALSLLPNCVLHAIVAKLDSGVDVASLELTSTRCRCARAAVFFVAP